MPAAKKKNRSNPEWIRRHLDDPYVKQSRIDGYRSRAAYKLIEIDDKDKFLKPGAIVVDLGAAPGSWTQVVGRRLAGAAGTLRGKIVALDILPMDPLPDVDILLGDFRDDEVELALGGRLAGAKVDVVLSDMAPNLSGIDAADSARSSHLWEIALEFACKHLKPDGVFLIKTFQGSGYSQFVELLKREFRQVSVRKPAASRDTSSETFLLARGLKESAQLK